MKRIIAAIAIALSLFPALGMPPIARAATADPSFSLGSSGSIIDSIGNSAGLSGADDLPTIIGRVIGVVLGILGVVFLVLVVYAGFLYLTSSGEEKSVGKAKKMLTQAVIGLVLIVSAYAITGFVTTALTNIASPPAPAATVAPAAVAPEAPPPESASSDYTSGSEMIPMY